MTREPHFDALTGDTATVLFAMFGPKQHDSHVKRYRIIMRDRELAAGVAKMNENLRMGRSKFEGVS